MQLGQDFRAITGQVHLEVVDCEMIGMQKTSWGVVFRTRIVGEGREQAGQREELECDTVSMKLQRIPQELWS